MSVRAVLIEDFLATEQLSDAGRKLFDKIIQSCETELNRVKFQLKRVERNKEITQNYLNISIQELETSNEEMLRINDKVKAQNELLLSNYSQLEMAYKELEEFTYIASHDLKTPVRSIISFSQLLERSFHKKISSKQRQYFEHIVGSAKHLHNLICNTLEYSKIDKVEANYESVDLNELMELVQTNLSKEIELNKAVIEWDVLPKIKANETAIIQLFQNLIGNAIKYRSDAPPYIRISSSYQKDHWRFVVSDNGEGIDPAYKKKVFTAFQRINVHKSGTGIGLAICMKIVKMHCGDISFEANELGGTDFIFTLKAITSKQSIAAYLEEQTMASRPNKMGTDILPKPAS